LEDAVAPEIPAPPTPSVTYEAPALQNSWAIPKPGPELVEPKGAEELPVASTAEIAPPVLGGVSEVGSQEIAKPNGANSWFSTSSSPWEAEAQKANHLASTWDAPPPPAATSVNEAPAEEPQSVEAASYDFVSEAPSEEPVSYVPDPGLVGNEKVAHNPLPDLISDGSISPETVENIRQETTYALDSVTQSVAEPEKLAGSSVKIAETSQQDMDALVANVLAKMSPEMLQAVTREILKPVVAAMIRDEINAKKA
jgi:transcription termination factor NusB